MSLRYVINAIIILASTTLFAQDPAIVITEIMYNPPESNTDSLEFIEILNVSDQAIQLEDYYFEGINFTFKEEFFWPGEYLVICRKKEAFQSVYSNVAFEWKSGTLTNSGEVIALYDADSNLIDSVEYKTTGDWPKEANGGGYSLVFCHEEGKSNDDPLNWEISSTYIGEIDSISLFADLYEVCNDISTGVEELEVTSLILNDQSVLFKKNDYEQIQIFDFLGREIMNDSWTGNNYHLNVPRGFYVVRLIDAKGYYDSKILL